MNRVGLTDVVVSLVRPGGSAGADREALVAAVASVTGVDVSAVRAGRACPHCGSTDHGRPWARVLGVEIGVSLSRTPDLVALAVGPAPVGVDVERVSRVAAAPVGAFTRSELDSAAGDPRALAACWAVKEAVLKRDGRGLRVDPRAVEVDLGRSVAVLEGVEQPVTVLFPHTDMVFAVAAGSAPVSVRG